MKIDSHQHFWRYRAEDFPWISAGMPVLRQDRMPADVLPALAAAGVGAVLAVQARSEPAETDFLLDLAARHPQICGVVGWVDVKADDLDEQLARWQGQPLKGLRHILQDEPDVAAWVADAAVNRGLGSLQRRGLCWDVLVHAHQLDAVVAFCARHDGHQLVLDHLGKPALRRWAAEPALSRVWRQDLQRLAALPHLACKLSGLVTEADFPAGLGAGFEAQLFACFDHALEAFGAQRLMYGSDWPVCELAAPLASVHGGAQRWAQSRLSAAEQQAFWAGNALRCYGLQAPPTVEGIR